MHFCTSLIRTIPLLLDTIISAIRLRGKEIFNRKSRREMKRQSLVYPSTARARVAAPCARAVQVVASAESEQAADAAADQTSAAAPDAAPAAQSDIPSFLGESQIVNALRVLHQIQNFFEYSTESKFSNSCLCPA